MVLRTIKYVFSLWWQVSRDKSSRQTCVGRLFQRRGPAAANARSPRREMVPVMVHLKLSDDSSSPPEAKSEDRHTDRLTDWQRLALYATSLDGRFKSKKRKLSDIMTEIPALSTMKMSSISCRMKSETITKLMAVMWIRRLIFDGW